MMTEPERIDGLPYTEYDALPGERSSHVRRAAECGLAYDGARKHPPPDSDAFRLGRATHTAVLEPLQFLDEYILCEHKDRRTKAYKAWAAEQTKSILMRRDYETAKGIADAVRAHPVASELLLQRGASEVTVQWQDQSSGVLCKARPDWLTDAGDLVDLKTARELGQGGGAFVRSVFRYGYHAQMAFYRAGLEALGMSGLRVKFIAVESSPPHDVMVFSLPWMALQLGWDECAKGLATIAAGPPWTGRAHDREVPIDVPEYILRDAGWEDEAA